MRRNSFKHMQAVLLAAGQSSRFFPYNSQHKCAISLLGEPIIIHTIRAVKKAGITDVVIVVSPNNVFENMLGNGKKYGVKIRYAIQKEPKGMGDAVLTALKYIDSDFFLLNSYRVDFLELKDKIDVVRGTNKHVILMAEEVEDVTSYGILAVDHDVVTGLIEKPKKEEAPSNLKVSGVYFLNQDFIKELKATKEHHDRLEIALDS